MADCRCAPLVGEAWADYGLVDSGHGRKLERYGRYRFIRPEPQAMWAPALRTNGKRDGEFVPGIGRGGRRPLAVSTRPVPREGWPLAWDEVRFTAQCTPFRHLGFFPDMAPEWDWMREAGRRTRPIRHARTCSAIPASARWRWPRRARGDPCRCVEEVGREAREPMPRCPAWPTSRSAGWSTTPPSSPRARCGASGAMTASSSIRPSSAAGPTARSGGSRRACAPLIADCRQLLDEDSRFLVLTVYAVRMSALAIGELLGAGLRRSWRHDRMRRNGGARGSAGAAAADRDFRALESLTAPRRYGTVRMDPAVACPVLPCARNVKTRCKAR